jgi:hypothetical protein
MARLPENLTPGRETHPGSPESQTNRGHAPWPFGGPNKNQKMGERSIFPMIFWRISILTFFRFVEDSVKMVKSLGVNSVAKINHLLSIGHGNKNEGKHGFPCHFGTMS